MANKEPKAGSHFSLEPLVHEAAPKGSMHISTDTKRVALVIVLAVASFLTVYLLSGSGSNGKAQLQFADDGSTTPAPTTEATSAPASPTPTSGSLAYNNGFPDMGNNVNGTVMNANQNGMASTVIRNSAYGVASENVNATAPTSGSVQVQSPSPRPSATALPTAPYPTATPLSMGGGQYGVIGSGGGEMAPTPTATPSPTPTPTPVMTPTAEPIKRGMEQSGPAAWMALLPVLMVGVFRFARKS